MITRNPVTAGPVAPTSAVVAVAYGAARGATIVGTGMTKIITRFTCCPVIVTGASCGSEGLPGVFKLTYRCSRDRSEDSCY